MIVCSCAVISDHDIRNAINWMQTVDPYAVVTPGRVYRALGKSPDCGGCISLMVETMRKDLKVAVPRERRGLRKTRKDEQIHEG